MLTLDWSTGFVEMDRKGPERLEGGLGWLVSALVITEYFWISQGLRFLFFKKKNKKVFLNYIYVGDGLFVPHCVWRSEHNFSELVFFF